MLLELHIHDFAIIEQLSLQFESGMTVLTGETGAGKSIIIDALGLLSGGRGSAEFVRHGAKKCLIEGVFRIDHDKVKTVLEQYEIESSDIEVIHLQREIYANGRTVCRVNGSIVTVSGLKEIGICLIDIHGQHEHQQLMQADQHVYLLDQFNAEQLISAKQDYQKALKEYQETKKAYEQWMTNEQEYAQRIDMLTFQVKDIQSLQLEPNEDVMLEEEAQKLANFQTISNALQTSYAAIQEREDSGLERIGVAMDKMDSISKIDSAYKEISETVASLFFQLQEVGSDIYSQLDQLEFDEERLHAIEERLNSIQQLKRKYGYSVEEILMYYEKAHSELQQLENSEAEVSQLSEVLTTLADKTLALGQRLSTLRRSQAEKLEGYIHEQLKELYMEKVIFKVHFKKDVDEYTLEDFNINGVDDIEFYITTNPGEPLKPLNKVASGGELSRMMLAIKTIFSSAQGITSIIFDEVDTGVSGRVAKAIADKIYSVAVNSQVLCISHLPQVAARADHHLYIYKETEDNRTKTYVKALNDDEKTREVARMLSGNEITEVSMEAALDLRRQTNK